MERAKRFGLSLPQKSPSIADVAMELDGGREVEKERRLSRGNRFGTGDISWMARCATFGGGEGRLIVLVLFRNGEAFWLV